MAFKVKTRRGEGDWRPNPLIPRCALCILAMIVIDSFVVIMGLTKLYKFVDLLLLCFVSQTNPHTYWPPMTSTLTIPSIGRLPYPSAGLPSFSSARSFVLHNYTLGGPLAWT